MFHWDISPLRESTATLALIALMASAALAPSAATAAPREFFGTIGFHDPTAKQFKRLGEGGVGTYRTNLLWAQVQAGGPDSYDWSAYDTLVARAARNRIRVLATIFSSPSWAARDLRFPPRRSRRDEFKRFVREAVERYGSNGDFWAMNPDLPRLPIRNWQFWNEENSPIFWSNRPSAKQYRKLLIPGARAVHATDPHGRVLLGGLFPTPYVKNAVVMEKFLKGLYRLGARKLFDAVAVHAYALTPGRSLEIVDRARRVMRRNKDAKTPIWITEVGWASSGKETPITVSPKIQARYLRRTFALAAKTRGQRQIAGVVWFSLQDLRRRYWIYRTGLFTAAGRAKPSWKALVGLTGGQP